MSVLYDVLSVSLVVHTLEFPFYAYTSNVSDWYEKDEVKLVQSSEFLQNSTPWPLNECRRFMVSGKPWILRSAHKKLTQDVLGDVIEVRSPTVAATV